MDQTVFQIRHQAPLSREQTHIVCLEYEIRYLQQMLEQMKQMRDRTHQQLLCVDQQNEQLKRIISGLMDRMSSLPCPPALSPLFCKITQDATSKNP